MQRYAPQGYLTPVTRKNNYYYRQVDQSIPAERATRPAHLGEDPYAKPYRTYNKRSPP